MTEGGFDFKKFIDETRATIFSPADYFSVMPKEGGFADPLIKVVIYSFVAGLINFMWGAFNIGVSPSFFGGMVGGGIGLMSLVMSVILGIIGLFIVGAIILVVSAICGGNTNYEISVRVAASISALSIVRALFSFFSGISLWLGAFVSIAILLYGIFLFYMALIKALEAKEGAAKVVSMILAVIPVLIITSTLLCFKGAMTLHDEVIKNIPAENQENATKVMNDMLKKAMDEAKKQQ